MASQAVKAPPEMQVPAMRLLGLLFQWVEAEGKWCWLSEPLREGQRVVLHINGDYDIEATVLGGSSRIVCGMTYVNALALYLLQTGHRPSTWPVGSPLGATGYWVSDGLAYHPTGLTDFPPFLPQGPQSTWVDQARSRVREHLRRGIEDLDRLANNMARDLSRLRGKRRRLQQLEAALA